MQSGIFIHVSSFMAWGVGRAREGIVGDVVIGIENDYAMGLYDV